MKKRQNERIFKKLLFSGFMLVVEGHREVPISGMHDIYRLIIIIFDCVHHSIKTREWKDIKNSALPQTYFHSTWK